MEDRTIATNSPVGRHLDAISEDNPASYLMFNRKKIKLVAMITIGRESDNDVVVDNKLASRHHAVIQKIRDAYFLKDHDSTNGTYLNGQMIPRDKYVKLNPGDKITIGTMTLVIS
jgi:pSer/pThr/pTyr-binding forkhead associated (FHA) protein